MTAGLGRPLAVWLGSILLVGMGLLYAGVPLGPIMFAGALTLAVTLVRVFRSFRSRP